MAEAMSFLPLEMRSRDSTITAKPMAKVCIHGRTVKCTMASGTAESSRGTEFGKAFKVNPILVSGSITRRRGTVCTFGATVTGMKENGKATSVMEEELTFLPTGTNTSVSMSLASRKEQDSTGGRTDRFIRANSKMV
jgi:hypothetical protein